MYAKETFTIRFKTTHRWDVVYTDSRYFVLCECLWINTHTHGPIQRLYACIVHNIRGDWIEFCSFSPTTTVCLDFRWNGRWVMTDWRFGVKASFHYTVDRVSWTNLHIIVIRRTVWFTLCTIWFELVVCRVYQWYREVELGSTILTVGYSRCRIDL